MQFEFNPRKCLSPDQAGYSVVDCASLRPPAKGPNDLATIMDQMGRLSSLAQGLKTQITTYSKCLNENQKVFIKSDGYQVQGFLKIGYRKLFYHNQVGKIVELFPLCVLDFYVHESVQRGGIGKVLSLSHSLGTIPEDDRTHQDARPPDGLRQALLQTAPLPQETLQPGRLHPPEQQLRHIRRLLRHIVT